MYCVLKLWRNRGFWSGTQGVAFVRMWLVVKIDVRYLYVGWSELAGCSERTGHNREGGIWWIHLCQVGQAQSRLTIGARFPSKVRPSLITMYEFHSIEIYIWLTLNSIEYIFHSPIKGVSMVSRSWLHFYSPVTWFTCLFSFPKKYKVVWRCLFKN